VIQGGGVASTRRAGVGFTFKSRIGPEARRSLPMAMAMAMAMLMAMAMAMAMVMAMAMAMAAAVTWRDAHSTYAQTL